MLPSVDLNGFELEGQPEPVADRFCPDLYRAVFAFVCGRVPELLGGEGHLGKMLRKNPGCCANRARLRRVERRIVDAQVSPPPLRHLWQTAQEPLPSSTP